MKTCRAKMFSDVTVKNASHCRAGMYWQSVKSRLPVDVTQFCRIRCKSSVSKHSNKVQAHVHTQTHTHIGPQAVFYMLQLQWNSQNLPRGPKSKKKTPSESWEPSCWDAGVCWWTRATHENHECLATRLLVSEIHDESEWRLVFDWAASCCAPWWLSSPCSQPRHQSPLSSRNLCDAGILSTGSLLRMHQCFFILLLLSFPIWLEKANNAP